MTHTFSITAGKLTCTGEIQSDAGGMYYFTFDPGTSYPNSYLTQALSDIILNVGKFLQSNGSLKEFTISSK